MTVGVSLFFGAWPPNQRCPRRIKSFCGAFFKKRLLNDLPIRRMETALFDNPYAQNWEPGGARRAAGRPAALALLVLATALAASCYVGPRRHVSIVSSPSHLRQIEVLALPAGIGHAAGEAFYLHNAGYRLPHHPKLLGTAYGPAGWRVAWHGADSVDIILPPGSRLAATGAPAGIVVRFLSAD
jgi:hypothetical protein